MSKTFNDMSLIAPLLKALTDLEYTHPTPIQQQCIPLILEGSDLLGCAQTGTGKTAAFTLPILQRLHENPKSIVPYQTRVLILAPTRELGIQIEESFRTYGQNLKIKTLSIYGGVVQGPQVRSLTRGVDVLVATPGRLLDLWEQKYLNLSKGIEVLVLDEADQMLDMGFIIPIKKIISHLPKVRQNLFFSATMPPSIEKLAGSILHSPKRVEVTPVASTVEKIEQALMYVEKSRKRDLLQYVLKDKFLSKVIVFTRTKHGANKVVEILAKSGILTEAIHGNKSQSARQRALQNFKEGRTRVLVATDIAARGIDVDLISHVINFEIPNVAESYVHRIGRTARAGATGMAISFCDAEEKSFIRDIEKLIGQPIPVISDHPYHSELVASARILSKGKAKAIIDGPNRSSNNRNSFSRNQNSRFRN
jgi:ATP-dependent RNA helicase RhlE